jgi:hypothetical protein
VRGKKSSVAEGRTAEIFIEQARKFFRVIHVTTPMGMRDRTILASSPTQARAAAVAKLRLPE